MGNKITYNIIWIDPNVDNTENTGYSKDLKSIPNNNFKRYKNNDDALKYLKSIKFQETIIIISGRLYIDFINKFKSNLKEMYVIPKIIIFTGNKEKFLNYNKDNKNNMDIINHSFYNFGGIKTSFNDIFKFVRDNTNEESSLENKNEKSHLIFEHIKEESQLTFEYINEKEQLIFPLLYKVLINIDNNDNIEKYTLLLYNKYCKNNDKLKILLGSIKLLSKIPIELLSKYYIRAFKLEPNLFKDINNDLREIKLKNNISFIKILYEGIKLKAFPLASNTMLYRASKISNNEIKIINEYLNKKKENLPAAILYSRTFLKFLKEKEMAENFLNYENKDKNLSKILFILEKDDNMEYNLSTHGDIENISFIPNEKEVLFFPFSSFEIKDIKERKIEKEISYEIKLLYLGKYLKDIEKDENLINKENNIPNTKFKQQIIDIGLIEEKDIINAKEIFNKYEKYKQITNDIIINKSDFNNNIISKESDLNNKIKIINSEDGKNKKIINNIITGEIIIKESDVNNCVKIINIENKKEFEDKCKIKINGNIIPFNNYYKFKEKGKYIIEYSFEINPSNLNKMFYECSSLSKINLSKFDSQNIIDMNYMFAGCSSLSKIDLTNFNTTNAINMEGMFCGCSSLKNINLTNFDTQNVINMSFMFYGCSSLSNIDLSNFNTTNAIYMHYMFSFCSSLSNIDLSNFNTKNVIDMTGMFCECSSLSTINLSNFETHNVKDMNKMFNGCSSLSNIDLSNFNTQNVTDMNKMFNECSSLSKINLSNFKTQNVTDISFMFCKCTCLSKINLSKFDTQKITDMNCMFAGCSSLSNINISNFNTTNVNKISFMFAGCSSLSTINLSNFDTTNVKDMRGMFCGCSSLSSINLTNFDTTNVKDMDYMFYECSSLISINLSNFDTRNVKGMNQMFHGCSSLSNDNLITKDKKILDALNN